jgi:hypothetical protein
VVLKEGTGDDWAPRMDECRSRPKGEKDIDGTNQSPGETIVVISSFGVEHKEKSDSHAEEESSIEEVPCGKVGDTGDVSMTGSFSPRKQKS